MCCDRAETLVVAVIAGEELRSIKLLPPTSRDTATMMDTYSMLPLLIHARMGSLLSVLLSTGIVLPLCFVTIYEIRNCFIVTLTFSKSYSVMLSEFDI